VRQFIRAIKTPVTLIVLLAILGYGAKWGYENATMGSTKPSAEACVMTDVGDELTPRKVTVRVFNGGTAPKAASLTKLYLNSHDFRVIRTGNSERAVVNTVIIGNSPDDPEVKLVQQYFADAVAEGDGRADHVVDVILHDKTKRATKIAGSVPVDGPICLPRVSATPSASPTPTK